MSPSSKNTPVFNGPALKSVEISVLLDVQILQSTSKSVSLHVNVAAFFGFTAANALGLSNALINELDAVDLLGLVAVKPV